MRLGDKMQRYFADRKEKDIFTLSQEDSYHVTIVMRMHKEDQVEVVFQNKLYWTKIVSLHPAVKVKIIKEEEVHSCSPMVTIVQSLVKEQKMDYILQKTTELGVEKIIPFFAERSVVKLEWKEEKKRERWQKIVKEASEQSKRHSIPKIEKGISLNELCNISEYDVKFLCTVNEKKQNLKKVLSNLSERARILFVIGPEGGFTEQEEKSLVEHDFIPISLGNTILRTETASTFIMSVVRFLDMR